MARPLHKRVILSIPLSNNAERSSLEIFFTTRAPYRSGYTHHYIVVADSLSQRKGMIRKRIFLPNWEDSEVLIQNKAQELAELGECSDSFANKYGNGSHENMIYIKNVIVSCFNEAVVDHYLRANGKMPKDICHVTCDSDGNVIQIVSKDIN